jgi:hypothetical protein
MNLDAVGLGVAFIDHFTVVVLKYLLPEASHSAHHSASNKRPDETVGGSGPFWHTYSARIKLAFVYANHRSMENNQFQTL